MADVDGQATVFTAKDITFLGGFDNANSVIATPSMTEGGLHNGGYGVDVFLSLEPETPFYRFAAISASGVPSTIELMDFLAIFLS